MPTILDIRVLGDPILRQATTPVGAITPAIEQLIDDMFATMYHAKGIGLAAPQVGRSERIAVIDVDKDPFVIINPEIITASSAKEKGEEGCLSIPDIYADVERPKTVSIRAMARDGSMFERDATELLARCLQHEIDHLDGRIFLDYLSYLKRTAAIAKWKLNVGDYPGFLRRVSLETPEDLDEHEHAEEEL